MLPLQSRQQEPQDWSCCSCICGAHTVFVPQIAQAASNAGLLHPKEKDIQSKVIKRLGHVLALRKTGEKKWCVGRERVNLLYISFWVWRRLTVPLGVFHVHPSGARLFVGSPYYELRKRSNKLCSQSDTSGEIPAYSRLQKSKWPAQSQKMELKLRTPYIWKHQSLQHWAKYTSVTTSTILLKWTSSYRTQNWPYPLFII